QQTNDCSRQDDLEVVAAVHQCRQVSEERADHDTKQNPNRQRVKLLRKKTDRDARDDAFDGRADDDAAELISSGRGEPRGQTVDGAEYRAEDYAKQGFGHEFSPSATLLLTARRKIFNGEK